MALVVADTSALVSLGTVANRDPNPLDVLLGAHEVAVPERVVGELADTAEYDDPSGAAAEAVIGRRSALDVRPGRLEDSFPLDAGENAAVALANDLGAAQMVCDEFAQLALVHASLAETRLVTTPSLLLVLVRNGRFDAETAIDLLDAMSDARSWEGNAYVERARATLRDER